jgi:hypothetical protein
MKAWLLGILLIPALSFAQTTLTVDLGKRILVDAKTIDLTKPLTFTFKNGSIPPGATLEVTCSDPLVTITPKNANDLNDLPFDLRNITKATVTLAFVFGSTRQLITQFQVNTKGEISEISTSLPSPVYYHRATSNSIETVPERYKKSKLIIYDPGTNRYQIYNYGEKADHLHFPLFPSPTNRGVIFLIRGFNLLKYDVSLSSSFNTRATTVPDLWSSVSSALTGAVSATGVDNVATELTRIYRLNSDLKQLLNADVADFDAERLEAIQNIRLNFGSSNGMINIAEGYESQKQAEIQAAGQKYTLDSFNIKYRAQLHLPITPDSLVTETVGLLNTLVNSGFQYQGNVIQLQNADQLQFTLNAAGKSGVANANLSVNSQPLLIEILNGIRMDFSTGFYYSNRKNDSYTLVKSTADTTMSVITPEGNAGGGTVGVAALLHLYDKISPSFSPALTLGLGKALDINYSVLVGGSLLIGNQNRVALTFGWNFANIKALSVGQQDANGNPISIPSSSTVNYYNRFRQGYFFGFTYSFGLSQGTQTASAAPSSTTTSAASTSSTASPDSSSASATTTGGGGKGKGKGK